MVIQELIVQEEGRSSFSWEFVNYFPCSVELGLMLHFDGWEMRMEMKGMDKIVKSLNLFIIYVRCNDDQKDWVIVKTCGVKWEKFVSQLIPSLSNLNISFFVSLKSLKLNSFMSCTCIFSVRETYVEWYSGIYVGYVGLLILSCINKNMCF